MATVEPAATLRAAWPPGLPAPVATGPLTGGSVAATWDVRLADGRRVVVKRGPHAAEVEADGLAALADAGVAVPRVLGHRERPLVLERVGEGLPPPTDAHWAALGRQVAGLHRVPFPRFGWHRDNHAGRFPQPNPWSGNWPDFFAEYRVRTHLGDAAVPGPLRRRLLHACEGPIQQRLRPDPPAVLTHGDLWRGNTIAGRWIVDPEACAADRELDLAYMQMSAHAAFPAAFWAGYHELLELPEGYPGRRPILQLHHRLLQVRHFGARQLPPLVAALDQLGW